MKDSEVLDGIYDETLEYGLSHLNKGQHPVRWHSDFG